MTALRSLHRPALRSLRRLALVLAVAGCQRVPAGGASAGDEASAGDPSGDPSGGTGVETGGPVAEYKCDPVDAMSCGTGQKCTALLVGGRQNVYECVPDDGALALYEACEPSPLDGQDKCSPGTICQPTAIDGSAGLCMALCVKNDACGGGACVANPFNEVPACGDACDPLGPLCQSTLRCRRTPDRFACQVDTEVDVGVETAQCLKDQDRGCSEGFVCEAGALIPECASPTGYCCTALCDLDAADPCASPAFCNPLFDDPGPGYEWVGACYVPF